ncbi:MAG: cation diffusion facilitator family transporter [Bacteroidales bacterium]
MNKAKAGYIEGIVSIITNTVLFILKLWAGIVTGSIALTADAWHTLSDSLSSVIVVIAVKLSSQKPDKDHPFGHGRWEQIAALIIAFILAVIAWGFMKDSVIKFNQKEYTQFGTLAIVVTIVSIVVKEALAQYAFYIGKKTGNLTVKADGWHHRSDALSSVVVLIGILFARHFWWTDSALGAIISVMLFYASWQIAREAINMLLGEKPSLELLNKITSLIDSRYGNKIYPHHFHIHNYVSHQELTFHIKLDNNMSIAAGHKIATDIENKIYEQFDIIATVHIEPLVFTHNSD